MEQQVKTAKGNGKASGKRAARQNTDIEAFVKALHDI